VDIDLAAPGIQFRVTPEVEGLLNNSSGTPYTVTRQFTLDFLNSQGAQIAIDASRYWPTADGAGTLDGSGTPVNLEGVVASAGSVYESFFNAWRAPPPPGISWPALNIGFSNQVAILYGDPADPLGHTPLPEVDDNLGHRSMEPPMALSNTVSGDYQVVSNGIPITPDRLFLANDLNPNPRTGIGFTTNNHLILVAVDGGGSPWFGMRVTELGWFMATNVDVFNAINADGGGSTTLAIATPEPHLVNFPSSGPIGRAVGGNLAVFAVPAYVAISNIADGSTFTAPSEIEITAEVLDSAGSVTNMAFYASDSLLGTVASGPLTLAWHNPPGGSYGLQVVAMDNAGLNTTSTVVNITVGGAPPPAPVTISPNTTGQGATPAYTFSTVSGAANYSIFLWDVAAATSSVAGWYTAAEVDPGNTGTGTIPQATPLAVGQYAWYVNAQNAFGAGPWSSFLNFSVGTGTPPVAPTPISPNTTGQSATPTYTFSTVSGAASYSIFLWDYAAGTSSVTRWYTAAEVDPGNTGTGTIPQATPLAVGQYAWYVNAQNSFGAGPWSSFLVFGVGP
jgi:hypothetical protein